MATDTEPDNSPASEADRASLDAAGRVAGDLPCDQCGYNLRTLLPDGRCPECGHPVAETLRPDELRYASPQYVRALVSGTTVLAAATTVPLVALVPCVVECWVGIWSSSFWFRDSPVEVILVVVLWLFPGAAVFGTLLLTRRDPRWRFRKEGFSARRFLRGLAWAGLVSYLPRVVVAGLYGYAWGWAFGCIALPVAAIGPPVLFYYLRGLMRQAGHPRLVERAEILFVCHILIGVFLLVEGWIVVVPAASFAATCIGTVILLLVPLYIGLCVALFWPASAALRAAARAARTHQQAQLGPAGATPRDGS